MSGDQYMHDTDQIISDLEKENKELKKYAMHLYGACDKWGFDLGGTPRIFDEEKCTCGLDELFNNGR